MTRDRIAPEAQEPYVKRMGAVSGKLYHVKHGRPLWAIGPEPAHRFDYREDFVLARVQDREVVIFLEEIRSPAGALEWVKVIFGESFGYLQCQMLSVGALLEPVEDPTLLDPGQESLGHQEEADHQRCEPQSFSPEGNA